MTASIEITHRFPRFHLDVCLEIGSGLTALVGPSGAGKTTILNVIAGLLQPDHGVIRLWGDTLVNTREHIREPSHRRGVGYVFQEPRLFPHLTVRQNLFYGRWFHRRRERIVPDDVIDLLNLEPLLSRYPARLSGGEKQRVAIGRMLLAQPRLLLLDEPLASVDVPHRREILSYLDRLRGELVLPVVYVTHAWAEVADRADQVIELNDGCVVKRESR